MGEIKGLYDASVTRDACGLGFVTRIDGRPSREIVEQGLAVLGSLNHRGATGADPETGDGAGLLVQLPDAFLRRAAGYHGIDLPPAGWYGTGITFSFADDGERRRCEDLMSMIITEEGQGLLGWRDVPVDPTAIGDSARRVMPRIRQVFIERHTDDRESFERKLYLIRRRIHRTADRAFGRDRFYVVSLSSHTMVYKGLLQGTQVANFYVDAREPDFASALALVHSRFSTNTAERWSLAHPYRYIAHNGEINTVRGNLNWMRARQAQLRSELFGHDVPKLQPVIEPGVSDSAAFDNAFEFLHLGGRSMTQAVMTMVPEVWENDYVMDADRRAFYHYSGALMQPWDGPAAIAFTNGREIGAVLDRNGLRPARYSITRDGVMVLASEDGCLPVDAADIVHRQRLGPGRMVAVDLEAGVVRYDDEAKAAVVQAHPYRQWVFDNAVGLGDIPSEPLDHLPETKSLLQRQRAFGYTYEDIHLLLTPMAVDGAEANGSMGTDTPLAVLSERPSLLFDYFHQLFAQVTNPAIDPLRERSVMSLRVSLGRQHNLLEDGEHHARRIILPSPVLTDDELSRLRSNTDADFATSTLSTLWPTEDGPGGLHNALKHLRAAALEAVRSGATILVISDRNVDEGHLAIPSLLAVGAVHQHLVENGCGGSADIVVETGEARDVHHVATLIAFGADAINPYLALESVTDLARNGEIGEITDVEARRHYVKAIGKGLLKVISKMGISTIHSYTGSQLFEIVGIGERVTKECFRGASSRIGGLDYDDLGREALMRHRIAFDTHDYDEPVLDAGGYYQFRAQGEKHQWDNRSVPLLQRAVRANEFETYEEFARYVDGENAAKWSLRSILDFTHQNPISIDEVEPASEIVKRFNTGAMSLGSISKESHEALAIAMNRIGGRSNSGEGGEDAARFERDGDGNSRRSAIKQVASGRFGVTAHYLVNADSLQIKVAQGAKPGEGGQLPGHKVSEEIAGLRHSIPGVGLISPPPHHDIYSIEDLKQLIYDLKLVNPTADVSVKLVSEAGVGTIACGVAKAKADHITIAGYEGGTGAAMLSSIKHCGLPWELGLAETQQALVANNLRERVRLQVDGQMKTGRDVVIGALLGAEEFGFSTAPLIAMGCVMMRVCHLNTCPVGIATQDPALRAKFTGTPENVVQYFFFVAEEVRELMAQLGFRTVDEMVGRVDKLKAKTKGLHSKAKTIDLSPVLQLPLSVSRIKTTTQTHGVESSFDFDLLPEAEPALSGGERVEISREISNLHLSIGGYLSGEIARRHGDNGLEPGAITLRLRGTSGQSFGVWAARGLHLDLEGAANDYTGKGLSGATIVVRPPAEAAYESASVATGNVALYGATSGEAFFRGVAGERFAIRNSGAIAVVEGVGDHGCEYMTGGIVVVLGKTGRNFAAGMSGGVAYLFEPDHNIRQRCNQESVSLQALDAQDALVVQQLVQRHKDLTNSVIADEILHEWQYKIHDFVKIFPNDLKRVLAERERVSDLELAGG